MTVQALPPLSMSLSDGLQRLDAFPGLALAFTDVTDRDFALPETLQGAAAGRRREFACGRLCAGAAAVAAGARHPVQIGRDQRRPVWPVGLVGSITHTAAVAGAVCASTDGYLGVGIDMEQVARMRPALHRTILTDAEAATAAAAPACSPFAARVFSAKEAGYKAINPATGHFIGFREAQIEFEPAATQTGAADALRFTIAYFGSHAGSRALHRGHGISVLLDGVCASLFVIPALAGG